MTDDTLQGVVIFEKDNNGDVLQTWAYPQSDKQLCQIAQARSALDQATVPNQFFTFSKYKSTWLYILTDANKNPATQKRVQSFAIALFSSTYHPEKYAALVRLLASTFGATTNPVALLDKYLAVMGGWLPAEEFDPSKFPITQAYLATSIRDVIRLFDEDIIHIWNALIMKKRIVVQCDKIAPLLKIIRAFPLFVWHRQDFSILRPYVTATADEVADLTDAAVYVAGFTDPAVKRQANLYDVYINLNERTVTIADHAQDAFSISPFHQELAQLMLQAVEDESQTDKMIIKQLTEKSTDLLERLEKLRDPDAGNIVTYESLQQRKLPPGMDKFLFAVAAAEGLTAKHA